MISNKDLNRIKLYQTSVSYIGKDASPNDEAPDEYGCADSVSCIIRETFGDIMKHTISTAELYNLLNSSKDFIKVLDHKSGDIIISPTGMGKGLPNGHVGIFAEGEDIMSNSSSKGTFENNFTLTSWVKRYRDIGGYPIFFFRKN